jgi:hypothetical protein
MYTSKETNKDENLEDEDLTWLEHNLSVYSDTIYWRSLANKATIDQGLDAAQCRWPSVQDYIAAQLADHSMSPPDALDLPLSLNTDKDKPT